MGLPCVTIILVLTIGCISTTDIVDFLEQSPLNQNPTTRYNINPIHTIIIFMLRSWPPPEEVVKEVEKLKLRRTQLDLMEKIAKNTIPHLTKTMQYILGKL